MATVITQDQAVLWIQENGTGTQYIPFAASEKNAAMTGKSIPIVSITPSYGRSRFGKPVAINVTKSAPGSLPSATIQIFERKRLQFLERMVQAQCPLNFQLRLVECGPLDNPAIWDKVTVWETGTLTDYTPGDGPSLDFSGENMTATGALTFERVLFIIRTSLSSLPTAETGALLAIAGISDEDCDDCGTGYPGADKVLYIGVDGVGADSVLASNNGGGTWGAVSSIPFLAAESVSSVSIIVIEGDKYRVIVGTNTTNAGTKGQTEYADFLYGDQLTPLAGGLWTPVSVVGSILGDVVEAIGEGLSRQYYGVSGDIYISLDSGETIPDPAVFTSANEIKGFATSVDRDTVWAFGALNMIVRERNQSGTFETRVGPTGGVTFGALAVAADETLFAGNGTAIYKSIDGAGNTGNWSQLKDFGASHAVVSIGLAAGSSQVIRAAVDVVAGVGEMWESIDGGVTWRQISALLNAGYNDAYFSETNNNLGVVVGDASGGVGIIQQLAED